MNEHEIYLKLAAETRLPSPSRVALEVIRLCYGEGRSLHDIAAIVETDPGLSARFLKYANSPIVAPLSPVTSIQRAAVILGIRGMVTMALSFSLITQQLKCECKEFSFLRFWSKSLAQAVAARALAQKKGGLDPDEVFTCALLSHIGELALATAFPADYGEVLAASSTSRELLHNERNAFEIDHRALSAEMLHDWGLPRRLGMAVRIHETFTPDEVEDEQVAQLAEILYLSLQIANICLLELPLAISFDDVENMARKYSIAQEEFGIFFEEVVRVWQDWGYLFRITAQQCPLYHQLKALDAIPAEEQDHHRPEDEILILAVDDDPMTLLNLTRILASPSRTIITAEDGEQALHLALKKRPDMVITDWRMPRLDGLSLCTALRRETTVQHTYIIMLTGAEADDELVEAFDAGADDYVIKPFTPKVLEARIRGGERLIRYQRKTHSDREVIEKYAARLAIANRKLQTMAMTDTLTGLPNRRSAMARLKDVVAESKRYGDKLSCIVIDVDHFKDINDTYGHDNGDRVLQEVAQLFQRSARSYDMVSRLGGEEFLVISTRSDRTEAVQLAERLRSTVEQHAFTLAGQISAKVTISLGVACWTADYGVGEELIKAADNALYTAKRNGRNRVETAWE